MRSALLRQLFPTEQTRTGNIKVAKDMPPKVARTTEALGAIGFRATNLGVAVNGLAVFD